MSFVIRSYRAEDCDEIQNVYRDAFAGSPWFEKLTPEEVMARWWKCRAHRGFAALVAVTPEKQLAHDFVVGSHWHETVTTKEITAEWNEWLGRYALNFLRRGPADMVIIWERHLSVLPSCQRQGVGTALRRYFLDELVRAEGNFLVLTRMRRDNVAAIRTAVKCGFRPTGVVQASKTHRDVVHEFWYCLVRGRAKAAGQCLAAA